MVGPGQGHFLYILGLVIVAAYVPLYWWRKISDKRLGIDDSGPMPLVLGSPGGIDLGDTPGAHGGHAGGRAEPVHHADRERTVTVTAPAQDAPAPGSPVRRKFGRRKFDKQPTQSAAVLIASNGEKIPGAAIRQALRVSAGEPVAVVTIARIYGSSLGLPNPGLMPTRKEMDEQKEIVQRAVSSLEKGGSEAWGQIAASRRPTKTIARAAAARGVRHVLVIRPEKVGWRRVVEGDVAKEVAKKLGPEVTVEGVSP